MCLVVWIFFQLRLVLTIMESAQSDPPPAAAEGKGWDAVRHAVLDKAPAATDSQPKMRAVVQQAASVAKRPSFHSLSTVGYQQGSARQQILASNPNVPNTAFTTTFSRVYGAGGRFIEAGACKQLNAHCFVLLRYWHVW